jgi:two-component system, LuxR family, sensor kinase FixL
MTKMKRTNVKNEAKKRLAAKHPKLANYSSAEFTKLVYELQAQQIELEHQNRELKKIHSELELSRQHYLDLFDYAPMGYIILNFNQQITQINVTAGEMLGDLRENFLNKYFFQLVAEVDQANFLLMFNQLIKTQLPQTFEVQLVKSDQTLFDAQLICTALSHTDPTTYQIAFTDVSFYKKSDKQTFELALESENIRILAEFLTNVGHDIRTPLTILTTGIYLLLMETLSPKAEQRIKILQVQVERLAQIAESMFQMSAMDSTRTYHFELFNILELVKPIIEDLKLLMDAKRQTLLFFYDTIPLVIIDPRMMHRALSSIIHNAILYSSEESTIHISVFIQNKNLMIEVKDYGLGISSSDLPHIFERFYRADKSRNLVTGGSGLGLAIAQKIIQAHQGQIEVVSEAGKGSVFRVTLPLPPEFIT